MSELSHGTGQQRPGVRLVHRSPVAHIVSDQERHRDLRAVRQRGRQPMVEFSVRIDFYRDLEGPKD